MFLAIIKFALPFFLQHPVYELHRDEFLYLEQGQHLAWGYMEAPPMLSWLAYLTHLVGNSFFWVKFWPSLFGALTLIVTCRMAMEMGGRLFAIFITALCIMFTAYLRVHFLFQANFLEIFWWSLSAYFILRYINTKQIQYLYWIGFAFGCGWLSKNSVSFFIIGFVAALILTKYRSLFLNKHLYGAGLLALVIALPNLIWQYNHNWLLLHHMDELRETQLKFLNPVDFQMGQLLMYFSAFFIWVMGLYPMLFAAGAVALQQWTSVKLKWIRWVTTAVILFLAWVILPMALPIWEPDKLAAFYKEKKIAKTGALKWEDQLNHSLPQDFADYLGWKKSH